MNRNVESHFSQLPQVDIGRSIFDRSHEHMTSFNVGDLIPFYVDEVLPGDTFNVTTSKVVRLQTMLTPIMSNLFLDTYFFFVPNRLVWLHWKQFCGENTESAWIPSTEYTIPTISAPSGGFEIGTIADYMGLPTGVEWSASAALAPSALPLRGYALICNEFFRDQNLTDPLNIPTGDANQTGTNGSNYISDVANGGKPFRAARYHDYFSSALPSPAKHSPVTFPLISGTYAPVGTTSEFHNPFFDGSHSMSLIGGSDTEHYFGLYKSSDFAKSGSGTLPGWRSDSYNTPSLANFAGTPNNLYADLSTSVGAVSINELRLAFQLQKFYERNARSGTRYVELLKGHFGVTSPDARIQRPEYLGGNRVPLNINEVTNTAQSERDFLGDLGAMSVTGDISADFVKSFTEHGYVIGVCVVRYDHTYSQGIERFWTRHSFTDFYLPVFANIGETPIYDAEIYATTEALNDKTVFGYNEAWADYRFKPNRLSGEMSPAAPASLASWHLGDYYTSKPVLSDGWIREDKSNVDRVLAVNSSVSNQVFADFYIKNIATRPMPLYSIPGLIDHN